MFSSHELSVPGITRAHKKSHGGCKTCKLRKVKCDETYPVCIKCKSYFSNKIEKCVYDHGEPCRSSRPRTRPFATMASLSRDHATDQLPGKVLSQRHPADDSAQLPKTVGALALDPFETQVKSQLPSANHLTHHYLSNIIGKCVPVGHTKETSPFARSWWPLVQADAFLYHVTLQASAFELEWLRGIPNTYHSEIYASECIRLLRNRVDHSVSGVSDQTIAAVATLAAIEYCKGNMIAMKIHIEGLKQMVKLRGGLQAVRSSSPTTANAASWFSMCITSEPLFPLEDDDLSLDLSQSCVDVPLLPESANQLDFEAFGVEKTVSDLMGNVRHLCRVFSYKAIQVIHRKDAVRGGDVHSMVNLIAQRLLHIKPLASVDPGSSGARITDACRFASLLFLFLPFDNHWPDPTFVTNSFLRGLKAALSSLVPSSGIENQLQIWLLAVGGVAELNPPEREWFIRRLVAVAADLELESWDDVEHCLERVIWIKAFNDSRFRQLWKEVRLASESMAMQNPFHGIRYCPRILQGTEKQASKLRELIL